MYSSVAGGGNTYVPGEVQRNGSDEGYDPELWNHKDIQSVQEHGSSKTSLSQVPATHKLVDRVHGWEEGSVNADIGGGRFDHYTETMKEEHGVTSHVYDPFNRDDEHNAKVASIISDGKSDTATVNNVLNVIKEPDLREHVIRQAANAIKDDGSAYFIVHEGDRSGGGKVTSKGWQENRPTASYIDEIAKHFGDVKRKGKLIIAKKGSESLLKQKYDKPGPKDPRRTPAPKKDRIKGSSKNPKGSASKANEKIEVSDKTEASLKKKMQEHNKKGKGSKATIGALKSVYRRGAGAFSTSHAPKMSRHGWAMARVNAFLTLLRTGKPDNSNYKQDNDLLPKGHPKKSKNSKGDMAMEYAKDEEGKEPDKHYAQIAAALAPIAGELIGGMMSGGDQNAKRTGPRPIRKPRAKGFKFDKDEMPQDVPEQDDVLDGDDEMALDQQSVQQIVEGLKPTIIDIVQEEIASIVGDKGMGPEDMLEDQEVEVVPDEEVEDMLDEEPEDAVMAEKKEKEDEPERNAKEHEDDPDKEAKCGYGKEMFEKVAEKHRLYEKDADHKGASQYMASMEEADKNAMHEYMKSDKAESHEKEAFRKCGSYGKDMKESYSKDSEIAEADKYRKELKQESEKYSKLQQQYSKLQSELVEAKDQLTEVRRSERYHKIADRLANLEAEGYSFDKERELEFCMQLSDDLREEHLAERIPQQYAKCPIGAPIPVEESEELKPIEQKSIKYSRSANLATQKLRAQGHKGVSFDKVLKHMCDNDTDECPSVEDLK